MSIKMNCDTCKGIFASKEDRERRLKICRACEIKKGAFCGACGCLVAALVSFKYGSCKTEKW
jgi:hypothetical protein